MVEYPFKDLLPLDEVLEREGYYNDWTHLDPEVFYSLTQISEYIKTKGYGVDVRLLIAQLAEHFGLRVTQITDAMNEFNDLKPKAELSVSQSAEALTKSQSALNVANGIDAKATNALSLSESADTLSKSVQEQFNQVVIDGDSSVEAAQARVDASGQTNPTLKARLDKEHTEVTAQFAHYGMVLGERLPNETDDTGRVQRLIDSLGSGEHGLIPPHPEGGNYEITGVQLKSNVHLTIRGNFILRGVGNTAFSLAGCLYTILAGEFHVELPEKNQIGFYIGKDENGKNAELNTLINASVEGNYVEGTTALVLDYTWVNRFYNCHFFRSENGLRIQGLANANFFYGCEIRGDRDRASAGYAILADSGGSANNWLGGVIENHYGGIIVKSGQLGIFGSWIEGIGQPRTRGVQLEGGNLIIKDSYFQTYVGISGGTQLIFEGNQIASNYNASVLNIDFPLIQYTADVQTKLKTGGNILPDGAYLTRFGKYQPEYNTAYIDRSPENIFESSDENHSKVLANANEITNAKLDSEYVLNFTEKLLDDLGEWNNGTFTPKNDGYYKATVKLELGGLPNASGYARLRYSNQGVKSLMTRISTNTRDLTGVLHFKGTSVIKMNANQPLNFQLFVSLGVADPSYDFLSGQVIIERYK